MPDTYDATVRSEVMRRVKRRDTRPEIMLRKALYSFGVRGWRCHRTDVPGEPDISFGRGKLAVFVDGAFWHGHPSKYWRGRSGKYWDDKISRNINRDRAVNEQLVTLGWNVLRLWDFEVEPDALAAATRVDSALQRARIGERVVEIHDVSLADGPPVPTD